MKRNTMILVAIATMIAQQGTFVAYAKTSENVSLNDIKAENGVTEQENIDFDITGEETRKLQEIKIEPGKKVKITNNSENKGMVKTKDAEFSEMVGGQIHSIKTRTDGLLEGKSTLIVGNDSKETITVYMLEDFGKNCTVEEYENRDTNIDDIDFDITGQETRKLQEIKIEPGKKVKITNNSENKGMVKTKDAEFSEMVEGQIHSIKTRTDGLLEGKSTLIVGNDSKETITVYMLEDFGKNCTVEEYENRDTNIDDIDFDITGEETRKLQEIKIEPGKKVKITNNSENKGMVKTKDAEFSEMVEGQIHSIKTRTDGLLEGKSTLIVGNDSKETITVYMLEDIGKNCTVEEYTNEENKPSQGNKDNKPIEDDKPNESNENKQNEDNKLNENDKLSENDQGDLISCGDVNSGLFASLALIVSGGYV